ncbi:hypothetical protein QUF74_12060 [Candidatus Halobeggiatoa sp. HSG11]|nr:hypothetical protein [Candidatus Halobeggiatoa sp. HSG11]
MLSLSMSILVLGLAVNTSALTFENPTTSLIFSQVQQPIKKKKDSRKRSNCDAAPKPCSTKTPTT